MPAHVIHISGLDLSYKHSLSHLVSLFYEGTKVLFDEDERDGDPDLTINVVIAENETVTVTLKGKEGQVEKRTGATRDQASMTAAIRRKPASAPSVCCC
ncbi:hypothetical protein [Shouchella shacheensis]|uniref:hypothetical protein n=1 Tax=Shouchella shacheensis TaxID=1649580 RepID=UPI00073FE4E9|nr:hypothetical protein [Shouchella shacheensis]